MPRYIDASTLMLKLSKMIYEHEKHLEVDAVAALFGVIDAIEECPTIDVEKEGESDNENVCV